MLTIPNIRSPFCNILYLLKKVQETEGKVYLGLSHEKFIEFSMRKSDSWKVGKNFSKAIFK